MFRTVERMQASLVVHHENDPFDGEIGSERGPGRKMPDSVVYEALAGISRSGLHLDKHATLPRRDQQVRADRVVEEFVKVHDIQAGATEYSVERVD
jgi:hypothetical protein